MEREEGNNHDKFSVSLLKHATVSLEFFAGVLALSQARKPSLVKLPIEESVVKVLPSASSTILFVLRTA